MADRHEHKDQTDGELLRAFLAQNDQDAFTALVKRHGRLVLVVCRRVLQHVQDAEDAFQATFLVLARQADSIRNKESLASWLHGVAYRMATNARRAAARWRKHENRASPKQSSNPEWTVAWQEVQALLDEELQRLPEVYREPFVLCCLENKSCAHVAKQLGLKEGTVRCRLTRARRQLQSRLIKRGVALTAVLSAAALSRNGAMAAVPPSLVSATVHLATSPIRTAGVIAANVLALVEGTTPIMLRTKVKISTALLLVAGVVAACMGAMTRPGVAAQQAQQQPRETLKPQVTPKERGKVRPQGAPAEGEAVGVSGRVFDPDGKPVAGAKLYLTYRSPRELAYPVRATTGANGRFQFTFTRSELDKSVWDNPGIQVMAVAKGHGCDWAAVGADGKTGELTLRLVKDVPVRGRILDPDGRPVAGAKLTLTGVSAAEGNLGGYLEAVRKVRRGDFRPYGFAKSWAGPLPGQTAVLTTGADGRFRLIGVGRERVVSLRLEGPAIGSASLKVMTRAGQTIAGAYERIHGASFDYLGVASRPIRGVVRDKATGKPLAGVSVAIDWDRDNHWAKAVTDKQGRYELLGLAKSPSYPLKVKPGDGLHFQREVEAARRRVRERVVPTQQPPDPLAEMTVRELFTILDEELTRLPSQYRAPLVLCYLQNRTRDEAARQLGYSLATLDRRLGRGRALLRTRLARRDCTFSAGLVPSCSLVVRHRVTCRLRW
ncbi:MAG: sigma-70 family RNA polymerase sigma factor [Planctomycetes bacterium]|nr:sigma-70 family RNA polymerase sigma factor [Planctomycetota bacterium]